MTERPLPRGSRLLPVEEAAGNPPPMPITPLCRSRCMIPPRLSGGEFKAATPFEVGQRRGLSFPPSPCQV